MDNVLPKIGEKFSERPDVYQLVVNDHITFVDPLYYGLTNVKSIDPNRYFVTSGDAVEKTRVLLSHYSSLIIELEAKAEPHLTDYVKALKIAAGQCAVLLQSLKEAKGDNCFLEIEWENHVLKCIPKNPRSKH